MKWFRFYHDAIDDPKVQLLPGELFKFWINALCLGSQSEERGLITRSVDEIAFATRVSRSEAEAFLAELVKRGLLEEATEGYAVHGWGKRQYKSDNVTDRVQEHRRRQGVTDETLHETLHATPDETLKPSVNSDSQITDAESEANASSRARERAEQPQPPRRPGNPMPRTAPAQTLLAVLHEDLLGIGPPTEFSKAVRQAQVLVESGCSPGELADIVRWLQDDPYWSERGIDIGVVKSQRDKYLASRKAPPPKPKPARSRPNGSDQSRAAIAEIRREMGYSPRGDPVTGQVVDAEFRRTS